MPRSRRRGRPARTTPGTSATRPAPPPGRPPAVPLLGSVGGRANRLLGVAVMAVVAAGLVTLGVVLLTRGGGSSASPCDPDPAGWNGAAGGPLHHGSAAATVRDRTTWTPAWSFPAESAGSSVAVAGEVGGPPSAANGTVYVTTRDGTLVALDARTGATRWRSAAARGEAGPAPVAPALDGCTAVVATGVTAPDGEPAGAVRAVDLSTHARRWGVGLGDTPFSAPQVTRGIAVMGVALRTGTGLDRDHLVEAFNLADGSVRFRERFRAAVLGSVATDGSRIWVADLDDSVYALDIAGSGTSLKQAWSFTTAGIISAAPVVGSPLVYVASADHDVSALDPATGSERWHVDATDQVQATPVLAGSVLVVAARNGHILGVDATSGGVRWSADLGTSVTTGMAAAGGRVLVPDDQGTVHVLDVATGRALWSWSAPAAPLGGPAIASGMAYIACADGRLYALPL